MKKWTLSALGLLMLAGCGVGNPWPTVSAVPRHHTVLMVGDSLIGETDASLPATAAYHGLDMTVIDAHINGAGLIGPVSGDMDALAWVQKQITDRPEIDTVVLEYVGACAVCGTPGYPVFGSDDFYRMWFDKAKAIVDYLHGQGKTVLWVKSPSVRIDGVVLQDPAVEYRTEVSIVLTLVDEVWIKPLVDGQPNWLTAMTDVNGLGQQYLWYNDALHKVRADDNVHLEPDGATRTATWTASTLSQVWATQPPPLARPAVQQSPSGLIPAGDPVTIDVPQDGSG